MDLVTIPHNNNLGFFSLFYKNDAGWYRAIAFHGYSDIPIEEIGYNGPGGKPQSPFAFFPAYPYFLKTGMYLTGLDYYWIALIFSMLISTFLLTVFFKFSYSFFENYSKAISSTLLLLILPFHFYFFMFYTESLFLSMLMVCFYCLLKNKWILFSIAAGVMVLTRPNGILMLIPLTFFYLERNSISLFNLLNSLKTEYLRPVLSFLSAILIFFGYCIYLKIVTGNFFAFSQAQADWYKKTTFPLMALFNQGNLNVQFNSVYTLLYMGFAIISYKKLNVSFQFLVWINLLLPMTAGSMVSMPRYISIIFPFVLIGSDYFHGKKYEKQVYWIFVVFHFISYYFWLVDSPIVV